MTEDRSLSRTVTFAEVAIWKNNPNAQFRLMPKHPIQGPPITTFRRWTADDIAKLKNMAQKEPCANVAAQLGRSVGATAVKAHHLGISLKVPRQGDGVAEEAATD